MSNFSVMKWSLFSLLLTAMLGGSSAWAKDDVPVLKVWPAGAPGEKGDVEPEQQVQRKNNDIHYANVTEPELFVYLAPEGKNTGASVLVCPGGGYNILSWVKEGIEIAEWLNEAGVNAFVLKYRVPRRKDQEPWLAPLQDSQRAMSMIRSNADKWDIDPERVGILGFSAGGNLTIRTSTQFDERAYEPIDAIDDQNCRPNFAIPIYPAYLLHESGKGILESIKLPKNTPPMFIAIAEDDRSWIRGTLEFALALEEAKVPYELHVYPSGGHGFGKRGPSRAGTEWPLECEEWMSENGFLKK
ncbi:alpha/beta hydrolase [Calycomorphotria hydatis]|uniref:Acetylxylan esterase n=1 Tax=Calycomorphotria hydatis TaxID=2528027 RepID=A0A517TEL0_9PLAN|nr:alpha/beta hydrolase [Calycomorphotria hydatis]QDT66813.1 Acetylxylan esterase precursor [Calycomorphotria hydatis]